MELATLPLSGNTNTVIIVPVMDNSIKFMPLVKPLDSRLRPELVGVWNSPGVGRGPSDQVRHEDRLTAGKLPAEHRNTWTEPQCVYESVVACRSKPRRSSTLEF